MQEELDKLRRLNHEKTIRLKQFGFEPDDLPSVFREHLTEFVRIKNDTGLLRLNDISLEQWYQEIKLDTIDRTMDVAKLNISTGQMEAQLVAVAKESQELTCLLDRFQTTQKTAATNAKSKKSDLEKEIEGLGNKLKSMKSGSEEVDIEAIMEKVQLLRTLKQKS